MTNALAQTTESIELSQILTQNTQTAKAANLNANSSSTSFSNIINGIIAKNQELKKLKVIPHKQFVRYFYIKTSVVQMHNKMC